jgi:hypothetical protein
MHVEMQPVGHAEGGRTAWFGDARDGVDGLAIRVSDLDALAGTPVLDVKPCLPEFAPRHEVAQPGWADELMREYDG